MFASRQFSAIWQDLHRFGPKLGFKLLSLAACQRFCRRSGAGTIFRLKRASGTPPIQLRHLTSDIDVYHQVFVQRQYRQPSPVHASALDLRYRSLLAAGKQPVILDCGANIGLSSIWLADAFPQAMVIAIEPEPANFALLKENVREISQIVPVNAGVSNASGKLSLHDAPGGAWAWQTEQNPLGTIDAITIDEALAMAPDGEPLVVKIDIEGHEQALFSSNISWISRAPLIIVEFHDPQMPWRAITLSALKSIGEIQARDCIVNGENYFLYSHSLHTSC